MNLKIWATVTRSKERVFLQVVDLDAFIHARPDTDFLVYDADGKNFWIAKRELLPTTYCFYDEARLQKGIKFLQASFNRQQAETRSDK